MLKLIGRLAIVLSVLWVGFLFVGYIFTTYTVLSELAHNVVFLAAWGVLLIMFSAAALGWIIAPILPPRWR